MDVVSGVGILGTCAHLPLAGIRHRRRLSIEPFEAGGSIWIIWVWREVELGPLKSCVQVHSEWS